MPKLKFDHIAFLVRDLDQAVRDYQQILSVLDPEHAQQIVWDEGEADGYKLRWATFVNPHGTSIQFFESQHPADQKLLEKYGSGCTISLSRRAISRRRSRNCSEQGSR